MTHPPLVSVIIPAYNVAPYIGECLASVRAQHYPAIESIVVNDGSEDSADLERELAPYLRQITYLTQPNRGAGAARNTAIRQAKGQLLAFLDGDDAWEPDFLTSQVGFLERGGYDMVYADALLVGDVPRPGMTFMESAPSSGPAGLLGLLGQTCRPLTSTTVVRTRTVVEAGLFDESIRRGQDFDLWVRLALRGAKLGYQREVLARYRQRSDSLSGGYLERLDRGIALLSGLRGKLALPPDAAALADASLRELQAARNLEAAKIALRESRDAEAAELFRASWQLKRSLRLLLVRLALPVAPGVLRRYVRRGANEG